MTGDRRTSTTGRSTALVAACVLAVLGAGGSVYAAIHAGETSQDRSASPGVAAESLTISGDVPGLLRPGAPAVRIPVRLTGATGEPVTVTGLTTVLETSGLPAGCSAAWFRIVQSDISPTSALALAADAAVTLPDRDASAPTIQLTETGTRQDACKGARLTLGYSASTRTNSAEPVTPRLTWATPAAISYGTRLSDEQLSARTAAPGRFVYDPDPGTLLTPGRHTLSASFRPQDTNAHKRATITTSLVVRKAEPVLTWRAPRSISFGTLLSSEQLDAAASVAGTFGYSPASGSRLHPGSHVLRATFTPSDARNHDVQTASVTLEVTKAQPTVDWTAPRPLTYPAKLSAAHLDAEASVPGSFEYSPPTGTVPKAGRATLSASFTPANSTDYATTTATVQVAVAKGAPSVRWAAPAPVGAGTPLSGAQLNAKASVPGAFVYRPAAGSVPLAGSRTLTAVFTPTDDANYTSAKGAVDIEVATTKALPAGNLLAIEIDGEPGIKVDQGFVSIRGNGLMPRSVATVYARSTPQRLGSVRAGPGGLVAARIRLPAGLAPGGHHIEVRGISASGASILKRLPFTVALGDRLGSIGTIPKGPFATLVPYEPEAHLKAMLAMMIGGFAALGALGAALGGGGRSAGSRAGVTSGGSSDGAFLEDVEVGRETMAGQGRARGDRSGTWRWWFTRDVDRLSVKYPTRLAAFSPVAGRVSVDGDYLRAMFGGLYVLLLPLAVGLGIAAAASTEGEALPPAFAWFVAILALSLFDALAGYVAGLSFAAVVIVAGGVTGSASVRELLGIVLVWFAVPLAAAAVRPIRRHLELSAAGLWDRTADFAIAGLFGGWLAANMVEALSPLAGYELPLAEQKWTIALVVIGLVGVRIVVETLAAHQYPDRLVAVRHNGELESGNVQVAVGLVCQIAVFIFIAAAFMKIEWPLFVGAAVFFSPLVPWLFVDRLPKSAFITRWMPAGVAKWSFVIIAGVLLSMLLERVIHDPGRAQAYAFILLPLPILLCWGLELFAREDDEEEEDQSEGRFRMTWPLRFAGVPVLGLCAYLILAG